MLDTSLEDYDDAFSEYMRLREIRRADAIAAKTPEKPKDSKEDYLPRKKAEAERRAAEKKIERAKLKITELEAELEKPDAELFGSAASDYVRAAEIDTRKGEIEEELLSLYEIVM
jgi:hypothetical protein